MRVFRRAMRQQKQPCIACGGSARWYHKMHVHHFFPVSRFPAEAAIIDTFRWVHSRCHFTFGHSCNWHRWQSKFDELAAIARSAS